MAEKMAESARSVMRLYLMHGSQSERRRVKRMGFWSGNEPIYVLGTGNLTMHIAHSLRQNLGNATTNPLNLIFSKPHYARRWALSDRQIWRLKPNRRPNKPLRFEIMGGFGIEIPEPPPLVAAHKRYQSFKAHLRQIEENKIYTDHIKYLIVTAPFDPAATVLNQIKKRLDQDSTILFLSGMSTMTKAAVDIFPDPDTRPSFWTGVCETTFDKLKGSEANHFRFKVRKRGPLMIAPVDFDNWITSTDADGRNSMIERIVNTTRFQAKLVSPREVMAIQIKDFVANAIVQPLTAVLGCTPGELMENRLNIGLLKLIISEVGPIVRLMLRHVEGIYPAEAYNSNSNNNNDNTAATAKAAQENKEEATQPQQQQPKPPNSFQKLLQRLRSPAGYLTNAQLVEFVQDFAAKRARNTTVMRRALLGATVGDEPLDAECSEVDALLGFMVLQAQLFGMKEDACRNILTLVKLVKRGREVRSAEIPELFPDLHRFFDPEGSSEELSVLLTCHKEFVAPRSELGNRIGLESGIWAGYGPGAAGAAGGRKVVTSR